MTGAELVALTRSEDLPAEAWLDRDGYSRSDTYGRHGCPVPGCWFTVRWGNLVCPDCWGRIPPADRAPIVADLRQRQSSPSRYEAALVTLYRLACEHASPNRRIRAAVSALAAEPGSDPAHQEESA